MAAACDLPEVGVPSHRLPTLPREVWDAIVRAAQSAEGDTLISWLRLRSVCGAWRAALAGATAKWHLMLTRE